MKKQFFIVCLLLSFLLLGCKKHQQKVTATQTIIEWTGRQIQYPDSYQCNLGGKDTSLALCTPLLNKEYRVLLYIDSSGCTRCKLRFPQWKQLIREADSISEGKVSFLFFIYQQDATVLQHLLYYDRMNYPVFIDSVNAINQLNHFPQQQQYQCFLLDKNNKVLLVGNPTLSPKIWELYKQVITGK